MMIGLKRILFPLDNGPSKNVQLQRKGRASSNVSMGDSLANIPELVRNSKSSRRGKRQRDNKSAPQSMSRSTPSFAMDSLAFLNTNPKMVSPPTTSKKTKKTSGTKKEGKNAIKVNKKAKHSHATKVARKSVKRISESEEKENNANKQIAKTKLHGGQRRRPLGSKMQVQNQGLGAMFGLQDSVSQMRSTLGVTWPLQPRIESSAGIATPGLSPVVHRTVSPQIDSDRTERELSIKLDTEQSGKGNEETPEENVRGNKDAGSSTAKARKSSKKKSKKPARKVRQKAKRALSSKSIKKVGGDRRKDQTKEFTTNSPTEVTKERRDSSERRTNDLNTARTLRRSSRRLSTRNQSEMDTTTKLLKEQTTNISNKDDVADGESVQATSTRGRKLKSRKQRSADASQKTPLQESRTKDNTGSVGATSKSQKKKTPKTGSSASTRRSKRNTAPPDRLGFNEEPETPCENEAKEESVSKRTLQPLEDMASDKSAPQNENGTDQSEARQSFDTSASESRDWTDKEMSALRDAHRNADPLSKTFWLEIAQQVKSRSDIECREKWFSSLGTPAAHLKKAKTKKQKTTSPDLIDDDDIFNATPMRTMFQLPSIAGLDHILKGSAIKVQAASYDESSPVVRQTTHGYKTYVKNVKRGVKMSKKAKAQKTMKIPKKKTLSIKDTEGDVEVKGKLSPSGTIRVDVAGQSSDEEDAYFLDAEEEEAY